MSDSNEVSSKPRPVRGPRKPQAQAFRMVRRSDESGVSGTGPVLEGCVFSNGWCASSWLSPTPSVEVHPSFEAFRAVHIDKHPGNGTIVEWQRPPRQRAKPAKRFCLVHDNDGHAYAVPVDRREEAEAFFASAHELEAFPNQVPEWLLRIEGTFTFTDPK